MAPPIPADQIQQVPSCAASDHLLKHLESPRFNVSEAVAERAKLEEGPSEATPKRLVAATGLSAIIWAVVLGGFAALT